MHYIKYISLLLSLSVFTQESVSTTLINKTELKVQTLVEVDNFETKYVIINNSLNKEDSYGNLSYSNIQLGNITSVNAFNPLKIIVFYKDFNAVIILDNRLAEITRIDFNNIQPFKNVTHISTANDNNLWLFNQNSQQLELFDYKTHKSKITTLPIEGNILDLKSNYNYCWVLTDKHIYVYNYFGSLLTKTKNDGFELLEENNGNLFLLKKNKLFYISNTSDKIKELELPELLIKQFLVTNETLYIYDDEFLHQYQLKIN